MKRNLIVLCGAVMVVASSLWLPAISYTYDSWVSDKGPFQANPAEWSGTLVAILILLVMLLKWKWRGVVWIVLSIAGTIWAPMAAYSHYEATKVFLGALDASATIPVEPYYISEPSYQSGLFIVLVGYATILAGGIWDIVQKRKPQAANPPAS